MARAELVVAVGDEVLDECTGRFRVAPQRAAMIPNGRDSSLFHPRSEPAETADATLIFVGALTRQKQPDRFVEVVRRLRAAGRPLRAVMVGDGPLAATLAPLAAADGIELLGPRSDVPELLRGSDVFVFTSLPTGEGMPGVLIEAGLSGLPAVSTSVPGAATVLRHGRTGVIVEDSIVAMAAAIGELLDVTGPSGSYGVIRSLLVRIGIQLGSHGSAVAGRPPTHGGRSGGNDTLWRAHPGATGQRLPACDACPARKLPDVARRSVTRTSGHACTMRKKGIVTTTSRVISPRLPRDEGVTERAREHHPHRHVGPGERSPGDNAERSPGGAGATATSLVFSTPFRH